MDALTHCEYEIQEVMKQIDVLVGSKQQEWEEKNRILHTRISERDDELQQQYEISGKLKGEISTLKAQLDVSERTREEIIARHETEIIELRKAFAAVKEKYTQVPKGFMGQLRKTHSNEIHELKKELKDSLEKLKSACRENAELKKEREDFKLRTDSYSKKLEENLRLSQSELIDIKASFKERENELEMNLATARTAGASVEGDLVKETKELRRVKCELRDALSMLKQAREDQARIMIEKENCLQKLRKELESVKANSKNEIAQMRTRLSFVETENDKLNQSLESINRSISGRTSLGREVEIPADVSDKRELISGPNMSQTATDFLVQEDLYSGQLEALLDGHIRNLQEHLTTHGP